MTLTIKNDATSRLARQVASEIGESLTEAFHNSLAERWPWLRARRSSHILTEQIDEILRRVDALPAFDSAPEDEILGYDLHRFSLSPFQNYLISPLPPGLRPGQHSCAASRLAQAWRFHLSGESCGCDCCLQPVAIRN